VPTAVTEAEAGCIETDERNEQRLWQDEIAGGRRWNSVTVGTQQRIRLPGAKDQRASSGKGHREQSAKPVIGSSAPFGEQRSQVGFIVHRPAEADAHCAQIGKALSQMRADQL